jgi:hypothetical protein
MSQACFKHVHSILTIYSPTSGRVLVRSSARGLRPGPDTAVLVSSGPEARYIVGGHGEHRLDTMGPPPPYDGALPEGRHGGVVVSPTQLLARRAVSSQGRHCHFDCK